MKKLLVVFGTRPEAVKMCPLVKELKKRDGALVRVCVTGQHKEMLEDVLKAFSVVPDYDLAIMKKEQTLFDITAACMAGIKPILESENPDIVLVHGDTTTAFAAALSAFYKQIPVAHIEAGLRTYDITSPYPEEFNREAIDSLSSYLFAPTGQAKEALLREGRRESCVFVTGNTGIDALKTTVREDFSSPLLEKAKGKKLVLLTAHRRENTGEPMRRMFRAVRRVAEENPDVLLLYPVHRNPAVREAAEKELSSCGRILLSDPLGVVEFHNVLSRSYLILTDSGGIQEEASSLGKPVLVMRNTTERPEGIASGNLLLVGTEEEAIYNAFSSLLSSPALYRKMALPTDLYGDGNASRRIADILLSE